MNGLYLIKPTSIASTGTSATINTNGSVSFTAVSSLSLNGVFSADYDNYMIVSHGVETGVINVRGRLRLSGVDDATTNSYTLQYLQADGTTVSSARVVTTSAPITVGSTTRNGFVFTIYGPCLAQPTAIRAVTADGGNSGRITDFSTTHNQSTAYDGFTIFLETAGSRSGLIGVYGMVK